jgi:hypothetical protein
VTGYYKGDWGLIGRYAIFIIISRLGFATPRIERNSLDELSVVMFVMVWLDM